MKRYAHPLFHEPSAAPGPAISAALIQRAEAHLGVRLPAAYVQALQDANGGPLRRSRLGRLDLRDLIGVGYEEGIDGAEGSQALIEEWGYPPGTVVLSFEGRCALLLDYRQRDEPQVIWVDTDTDAQQVVAPDMAAFLEGLEYPVENTQVALHRDEVSDQESALALARALGAQGEVRADWTGAHGFSIEEGLFRVRPNRYRGMHIVPELVGVAWILEIRGQGWAETLEALALLAPRSILLTR